MADDTVNACAQAPTLDEPLYVIFHDYYRYWYRDKNVIKIPSVFSYLSICIYGTPRGCITVFPVGFFPPVRISI